MAEYENTEINEEEASEYESEMTAEEEQSETIIQNESAIFSGTEDGSNFIVRFDDIFDKPKLDVYNSFDLSTKRNFKMMCGLIIETYEKIFTIDGQFDGDMALVMLHMLNAQNKVMHEQSMSMKDFMSLIDKILSAGNGLLLNRISKFVEDGYQLSLDDDTRKMKEKKKAVNDQLIISDDYGKTLIKIAYLDRVMIPLISQYYMYNKGLFPAKTSQIVSEDGNEEDKVFEESNQIIFNHLFQAFAKENTENIQNKLYKMVYARIVRTAFSAKRFWSVAETLGITKESSSLEIYTKLLTNSVPKIILSKELNVVNYFASIINNQIMFLFSNKFKTHYQTINPTSTAASMFESNDDNMTELERIEIRGSRKNEGNSVIQEVIAENTLKNIDSLMGISVSKEEIANTLQYIRMNPIQERIVSILTFKYFESTESIKRITAYDYAKLLVCCVKYLSAHKFILLPKLLLSRCIKQRDRTTITGIKIKSKIEESKRYQALLETKYHNFKEEIQKPIQSMISTVYNSSFVDIAGNDIFDSTMKIGNVGEEIIDLCYLI